MNENAVIKFLIDIKIVLISFFGAIARFRWSLDVLK